MFRRLPSGLPKDPVYPASLEGLGYFITENDEIRNVENPKAYFKFFLTKNERYNDLQRESMNEVIRNEVSNRLTKLDLVKILLPLGVEATKPHVPIFISSNLSCKKRIIILFYEHHQDLGILAHRILGGKGGIKAGSVINFVEYIQSKKNSKSASHDDDGSPGIILANMGQLRWWRKGKKAVSPTTWNALPQASAVDTPYRFDEVKNTIPENRNSKEHVNYIFNHVVEGLAAPDAKIDIVGVSAGAYEVSLFLDDEENWKKWGARIEAFAALATYFQAGDLRNEKFAEWYKMRGRAYITSDDPEGTFLAGPEGSRKLAANGCPSFSLGEPYYSESLLPKGYKTVIDWFQEVAVGGEGYQNPEFFRLDNDDEEEEQANEDEVKPAWEMTE